MGGLSKVVIDVACNMLPHKFYDIFPVIHGVQSVRVSTIYFPSIAVFTYVINDAYLR